MGVDKLFAEMLGSFAVSENAELLLVKAETRLVGSMVSFYHLQ